MFKNDQSLVINRLSATNFAWSSVEYFIYVRDCSIITPCIGSGWVSEIFVMLLDEKQGGEGYLMKGRNVTV